MRGSYNLRNIPRFITKQVTLFKKQHQSAVRKVTPREKAERKYWFRKIVS